MKRLRPILAVAALAAFSCPLRAEISQEEYRQMQTRFQQAEEDMDRLRARVQKLEAAVAELSAAVGEEGRKALVRRLAADVIREAREGVGS